MSERSESMRTGLIVVAADGTRVTPEEEAPEADSVSESGLVLPGRALDAGSEPLGGGLCQAADSERPQVAHEDADGSRMRRESVQALMFGRQIACWGLAECPLMSSLSWRCGGPEPCIMAERRRCPGLRAAKRNLETSSTVQRRVSGKSRWRAARYVSRWARSESGPLHIGSSHRRSVHSRRHSSPG